MRNSLYLVGLAFAVSIAGAHVEAQASSPDSAMYAKAQELVSNGEAEAGRKIVDSLLNAAPSGSPQRAEGLYWRATLAASAKDAEQDYRRIVVDHPLSPRVPDALLRMGEMESARGDREAALQHFHRLTLEHPESPLHAEASYWLAHTYFETNDVQNGCAANADALSLVRPANVELKNRIAFQQQRCRGVVVAQSGATPNSASTPIATPAPSERATASAAVPVTTDTAVGTAHTGTAPKPAGTVASRLPAAKVSKTAAKTTSRTMSKTTAATRAKAAAHARPVRPARAPSKVPARVSAARAHAAPPAGGTFAVQVAAFGSKSQANELAVKLRGRGYSAHVDGVVAPYRVRIGSYSSHASAVAEQQRLRTKQISGFVTPE
ncbi:MAG: SPOR domain-containing protein [Gemmatimonadaceae bacterium]